MRDGSQWPPYCPDLPQKPLSREFHGDEPSGLGPARSHLRASSQGLPRPGKELHLLPRPGDGQELMRQGHLGGPTGEIQEEDGEPRTHPQAGAATGAALKVQDRGVGDGIAHGDGPHRTRVLTGVAGDLLYALDQGAGAPPQSFWDGSLPANS